MFSQDPEGALQQLKGPVILDEAQQVPALFPVLRSYLDTRRQRNGQCVILGSASPQLIKEISESLAGRTTFLEITPFHWHELAGTRKSYTLPLHWFRGGFPGAFLRSSHAVRVDWFDAYTRTFLERDLTALGIEVSPPQMRRLWTMLAHCHGTLWNASQLAASLGVSYHTVNRYTDILEQTFLIRKLQPYFANVGKRVVKSPKIYFRDTGLLHYFLGLQVPGQLATSPARGASWEGFIIEQLIAAFSLWVPGAQAFFWRTAAGAEVDLLIAQGRRLIPCEVKLHSAPSRTDLSGLLACMRDLQLTRGYVFYPGQRDYSLGQGVTVLAAERIICQPHRLLRL